VSLSLAECAVNENAEFFMRTFDGAESGSLFVFAEELFAIFNKADNDDNG